MRDVSFPDWVVDTLEYILSPDYYGKIILHYRSGEIAIVRSEQTFVKNSDTDSDETFGAHNE